MDLAPGFSNNPMLPSLIAFFQWLSQAVAGYALFVQRPSQIAPRNHLPTRKHTLRNTFGA
jgi:hypothetical protein